MAQTKTKNLRAPFDSKTGAHYGRKGGQVKSERKKVASAIRATKHGRYTQNKVVLKAITPTPVERAAGVTLEDKLEVLKRIAPTLATHQLDEALVNYGITLVEIKNQILKLEKLYEKYADSDSKKIAAAKSLVYWKLKYAEKEWEFVRNVHGVGKPNFNFESITETKEKTVTLGEIMEEVLGAVV